MHPVTSCRETRISRGNWAVPFDRASRDAGAFAGWAGRAQAQGRHACAPDPVTRATFDIPITRREVEQRGSSYSCQLISRTIEQTPLPIMARFAMQHPEEMLRVKALHLADNRPYIFEDRWIDIRSMPEVLEVDFSLESANEWLVRNKPYSRLDVRFSAMNAEGECARYLDTPKGSALFVIERTTWIGAEPITTVQAVAAPGYQLVAQN